MEKKNYIIGIFIFVIAIIYLFFYFNQTSEEPINDEEDRSLISVLRNDRFLSEEYQINEFVSGSNGTLNIDGGLVTYSDDDNILKFGCNNKEVIPKLVSSYRDPRPNIVGGFYDIYVVDCQDFSLIYYTGDSGLRLFGPFINY